MKPLLLLLLLWSCSHNGKQEDTKGSDKGNDREDESPRGGDLDDSSPSIKARVSIMETDSWDFLFHSGKETPDTELVFVDRRLISRVTTNLTSGGTSGAYNKRIISYNSVGSIESWRPDASKLSEFRYSKMKGWANEYWIDLSKWEKILPIMKERILELKNLGAHGVYFDNADIYANTDQDINLNLTYLKKLAEYTRSIGLVPGLNNSLKLIHLLVEDFGFFINESCNKYSECHYYFPVVKAGKPIFQIVYREKDCKPVKGHSVKLFTDDLKSIVRDCK